MDPNGPSFKFLKVPSGKSLLLSLQSILNSNKILKLQLAAFRLKFFSHVLEFFYNELHVIVTQINSNFLSDSPDGVLNTEAFSDDIAKDFYFSSKDPFNQHSPDMLIPIFMMVEFLAYLGWIKVAESLLNPFGEDDEDFDIDYLIDRNIWVSYMIVDTATDTELEAYAKKIRLGFSALAPTVLK